MLAGAARHDAGWRYQTFVTKRGWRGSLRSSSSASGWRRTTSFISEVVTELKKVLWPGKNEVVTYSSGHIGVVCAIAALIWVLDWAFRNLTTYVLALYPK